jgi:FdhD protein
MDEVRPGRTTGISVTRYEGTHATDASDDVVTEEPLEIRLRAGDETRTLAVTMRTPGNDLELAAGFLFSESLIASRQEIAAINYCVDPAVDPEQRYNIVNVDLRSGTQLDTSRFERHFTMNSSCGVCGKANLEALADVGVRPIQDDVRVAMSTIYTLPERMREAQKTFATTGGLHAAALFSPSGTFTAAREDIGRHNALDKLVGWALMNDRIPLTRTILCVSGRASYEILQKAAVARVPIVCAVSAPSSLAVQLAHEFNITLVAFVRGERANVYSGPARLTQ